MTLAWVESEIEQAANGPNTAKNVYDLAALIIVRNYLMETASVKPVTATETEEQRRKREAVILTSHSADLDVVPTIGQIEEAIGAVAISTPDERKRVKDAKTWASILRGSQKS